MTTPATNLSDLNTLKNNPSITGNLTVAGGRCNIHGGSPVAVPDNRMQTGSLTIGSTNLNYGGGTNWNANTAGLMFECADNTEIAVHDAGQRINSLIYFQGGGVNKHIYGRNMAWGSPTHEFFGNVIINGIGTDLLKIKKDNVDCFAINNDGTLTLGNIPWNRLTGTIPSTWYRLSGGAAQSGTHWVTDHIPLSDFLGNYNETKYLLIYAASYDGNNNVDTSRYSFGALGLTKLNGSIRFNYHAISQGSNIGLDFFNYGETPFINYYQHWINSYIKGYVYISKLN